MKNTLFNCAVLACVAATVSPTSAEVITIGKGSGIVWEGLPFNKTLSGPLNDAELNPIYGLLAISSDYLRCMESNELQPIAGYMALPLGSNNVGLVTRATGIANYSRNDGKQETLTGSIGLPDTGGAPQQEQTPPPLRADHGVVLRLCQQPPIFTEVMHPGPQPSRERGLSWPTESKPVQK